MVPTVTLLPLPPIAVVRSLALLLAIAPAIDAQEYLREQTDLLRRSPKHFVTVIRVDAAQRQAELLVEGEATARSFGIEPDAEVKIHGTWGQLDQLAIGDRAWIWMYPQKSGERGRVFVIADEISEQEIHGLPWEVVAVDTRGRTLELRRQYGKKTEQKRTLALDESLALASLGEEKDKIDQRHVIEAAGSAASVQPKVGVEIGAKVFVQTTGGRLRLVLDRVALTVLSRRQGARQRAVFATRGLPATVAANHPFAGEIEVMVDHAGMRFARHQQVGVEVKLVLSSGKEPLPGTLRGVDCWHEKTRLRIATRGADLAEVRAGQRIRVRVAPPPDAVLDAEWPAGAGRAQGLEARVAWILANTYCSCSIAGDVCTGMFYTLASCNPKTCGMPEKIRTLVAAQIDAGKTDVEILRVMRASRGPLCLRPHLLR